jgi:hypothetical protein
MAVLCRQDHALGFNDQWRAMGQCSRPTFVVLDRAGHGVTFEQPAILTTLIDDWLSRVTDDLTTDGGAAPARTVSGDTMIDRYANRLNGTRQQRAASDHPRARVRGAPRCGPGAAVCAEPSCVTGSMATVIP